jgi:hypothetical protein
MKKDASEDCNSEREIREERKVYTHYFLQEYLEWIPLSLRQ